MHYYNMFAVDRFTCMFTIRPVVQYYMMIIPKCVTCIHAVYSGCRMMFYELIRDHILKRDINGRYPLWYEFLNV